MCSAQFIGRPCCFCLSQLPHCCLLQHKPAPDYTDSHLKSGHGLPPGTTPVPDTSNSPSQSVQSYTLRPGMKCHCFPLCDLRRLLTALRTKLNCVVPTEPPWPWPAHGPHCASLSELLILGFLEVSLWALHPPRRLRYLNYTSWGRAFAASFLVGSSHTAQAHLLGGAQMRWASDKCRLSVRCPHAALLLLWMLSFWSLLPTACHCCFTPQHPDAWLP